MATSVMTTHPAQAGAPPLGSGGVGVPIQQQARLVQQQQLGRGRGGYPAQRNTGRRYRQQQNAAAVTGRTYASGAMPQQQSSLAARQFPVAVNNAAAAAAAVQPLGGGGEAAPVATPAMPMAPSYPQMVGLHYQQQQSQQQPQNRGGVVDASSQYRRVERPKEVTPDDEVRVTAAGRPTRYVTYASKLFKEQQRQALTLRATGAAVSVAVAVCEVVKRRFKGLHQITRIGWTEITDEWEPLKPGLEPYTKKRSLPSISILLTFDDTNIDKSAPGYQAPLDDSLVEERDTESLLRPNFARPRRPRGRRQPQQQQQGRILSGPTDQPSLQTGAGNMMAGAPPAPTVQRTVAPAVLPGAAAQPYLQQTQLQQPQRPRRIRGRRNNRRRAGGANGGGAGTSGATTAQASTPPMEAAPILTIAQVPPQVPQQVQQNQQQQNQQEVQQQSPAQALQQQQQSEPTIPVTVQQQQQQSLVAPVVATVVTA